MMNKRNKLFKGSKKNRMEAERNFYEKISELAVKNGYEINNTITIELKRKFTITEHGLKRIKELGIRMPIDCEKFILVKGNSFYSNRFENIIKKYSKADRNTTNSYWTDGNFVYICRSKRAGQFKIITVL